MDLIRLILLELERRSVEQLRDYLDVKIEGRSDEEISYHIMLMSEAGLIEAIDLTSTSGFHWLPGMMTPMGHDFLDAARESKVWSAVKKAIGEKLASMPIEVLFHYLKG